MDREEGMDVLSRVAWFRETPAYFRGRILSLSRWERREAGAPIQTGGEEDGEISGLTRGIVEMRTVLGRADTPILHYVRPVYWSANLLGSSRAAGGSRPRSPQRRRCGWRGRLMRPSGSCSGSARSGGSLFRKPTLIYTDIALSIAADLMTGDSERRCAAVLLRLSGRRLADPESPELAELDHPGRSRRRGQPVAQLSPKHGGAAG